MKQTISDVFRGMASILDLGGACEPLRIDILEADDEKALANSWIAVGEDLAAAMSAIGRDQGVLLEFRPGDVVGRFEFSARLLDETGREAFETLRRAYIPVGLSADEVPECRMSKMNPHRSHTRR